MALLGLTDTGSFELLVGDAISIRLATATVADVVSLIRADRAGRVGPQHLVLRSDDVVLEIERPPDHGDGLGMSATLTASELSAGQATITATLLDADVAILEAFRDGAALVRCAWARLLDSWCDEVDRVDWARVSIEGGLVRIEPRDDREALWEETIHRLVASVRRGEAPSLASPPPRVGPFARHMSATPASPSAGSSRVQRAPPALATPSYLKEEARPRNGAQLAASAALSPTLAPSRSNEPVVASTEPINLEHLRNLLFRGPTPFAGTTTPERLAELREEPAASASTELVRAPDADETAMYMPSAVERAPLATLPFTPSSPSEPDLSVDQYAAIAAELQIRGASSEVLSRYGIATSQQLQALHAEQERRFVTNPALRARFEERRAHFLRFLQEPRR